MNLRFLEKRPIQIIDTLNDSLQHIYSCMLHSCIYISKPKKKKRVYILVRCMCTLVILCLAPMYKSINEFELVNVCEWIGSSTHLSFTMYDPYFLTYV